MIKSSQARKQRRFRLTAPAHATQHFVRVGLDRQLAKKLGIKRRTVQLSKGDSVAVVSGAKKGKSGKVIRLNMRRGFAYIDTVTRKNAKGKELNVPVYISNLKIMDLNLTDKYRANKLSLKAQPKAPEKKEEKKAEALSAPEAKEEKVEQKAAEAMVK
ncbi:MAG: 50S ribosomal protein L24 [Candidatus Marsarchaeota archaeon]|nr:50S ribosomal protein L24 [Candidatus Marsarchaeota archaeon]